MASPVSLLIAAARRAHDIVLDAAGGPARARVVLTLAAVLGLSGADTGTVTSTENNLEHAFHVGNTQIGILLSVVALVGAAFTIPMGVLVDRTSRVRLLTVAIGGVGDGGPVLRRRHVVPVAAGRPGGPSRTFR